MADPESDEESAELIFGVHPVMERLDVRPRSIERILCIRDRQRGLGRILRAARESGVPVTYLPADVMARKVGRSQVHQGVAAIVAPLEYAEPGSLCRRVAADEQGILVMLDGVVDPRNLGASIRTCAAAGVGGVLLAGDSTVGLTPAAIKTSAGTVERVPVAREAKTSRRLGGLKQQGFRAVGLSARGGIPWDQADLTGRIILVAGGESRGLRPGTAQACDTLVEIPLESGVESLNVGVALGVLLFEALRQRRAVLGRS